MTPIEPQLRHFILPELCDMPVYAKDQPEYTPLPAIRTFDALNDDHDPVGKLCTTWQPSGSEIEALKLGRPVTITLLYVNHHQPISPMRVEVGGVAAGIDLR